jgi:hypothetical protein
MQLCGRHPRTARNVGRLWCPGFISATPRVTTADTSGGDLPSTQNSRNSSVRLHEAKLCQILAGKNLTGLIIMLARAKVLLIILGRHFFALCQLVLIPLLQCAIFGQIKLASPRFFCHRSSQIFIETVSYHKQQRNQFGRWI